MSYVGLAVLIGALVLFGVWYGQRQAPPQEMGEMGSIQSHRSFEVRAVGARDYMAGAAAPYMFEIVDDEGTVVKDFAVTHEKLMHVIVVRHDLTQFQHVHPEFDKTSGTFTLPALTFAEGGTYRIFADFAPLSAQRDAHGQPLQVVLFEDIAVQRSASAAVPINTQQRTFVTDGYTFTLATVPGSPRSGETVRLRFVAQEGGRTLTNLETYLGALGHVVVLRQGDLEYLHTHPVTERQAADGIVEFEVTFPTAGTYKVFGQFQHGGKVLTSEFGVAVEQGAGEEHNMDGDMMEMMEHMMPEGEMMSH